LHVRSSRIANAFLNDQMPSPQIKDEYHRLVAENMTTVLLKIMNRFYGELGIDAGIIPLVHGLDAFRKALAIDAGEPVDALAAPVLVRFERAFAFSEAGRVGEALPLYESVFRDPDSRRVAPHDPFVREALVRSGEFVGRHYDKRGDAEAAIGIYREILLIYKDGLIARRLLLLLMRRRDFREAAELSGITTATSRHLFPHLPANNPYIAKLQSEFLTQQSR
jgi:hypothetical protein